MKLAGLFAVALTMFLVGCGKPSLGDECDTAAAADQCADTLVCGDSNGEKPTCQSACFTTSDCGTNEDCVPSATSTDPALPSTAPLACRPR